MQWSYVLFRVSFPYFKHEPKRGLATSTYQYVIVIHIILTLRFICKQEALFKIGSTCIQKINRKEKRDTLHVMQSQHETSSDLQGRKRKAFVVQPLGRKTTETTGTSGRLERARLRVSLGRTVIYPCGLSERPGKQLTTTTITRGQFTKRLSFFSKFKV